MGVLHREFSAIISGEGERPTSEQGRVPRSPGPTSCFPTCSNVSPPPPKFDLENGLGTPDFGSRSFKASDRDRVISLIYTIWPPPLEIDANCQVAAMVAAQRLEAKIHEMRLDVGPDVRLVNEFLHRRRRPKPIKRVVKPGPKRKPAAARDRTAASRPRATKWRADWWSAPAGVLVSRLR